MKRESIDSEIEFMAELDAQFRQRSRLQERRFYSIFYSRIPPSPLMLLGINPGGNPDTWSMPEGADEFCSAWQHDYVDERYDIQAAMQPLLKRVLGIDDAILRRIPKTNMVFRRSQGVSKFREQQGGMSLDRALDESSPVLEQIIRRVSPRAIIFEGHDALAMFNRKFGTKPLARSLVEPVKTPNGRYPALIYAVHEIESAILPHPVLACTLAHPSKYARRQEFSSAEQDMIKRLAPVGELLRALGPPAR
jgi:uracil-DNA glycosylase